MYNQACVFCACAVCVTRRRARRRGGGSGGGGGTKVLSVRVQIRFKLYKLRSANSFIYYHSSSSSPLFLSTEENSKIERGLVQRLWPRQAAARFFEGKTNKTKKNSLLTCRRRSARRRGCPTLCPCPNPWAPCTRSTSGTPPPGSSPGKSAAPARPRLPPRRP